MSRPGSLIHENHEKYEEKKSVKIEKIKVIHRLRFYFSLNKSKL